MSGPMLIRSVTLSEDTTDAWKSINGWYPRRDRTTLEMLDVYLRNECHLNEQPIINLGNSEFDPSIEELAIKGINPKLVFNIGRNIRPLIRPGTTREILHSVLPPQPRTNHAMATRFWVKAPGAKGVGKTLMQSEQPPKIPKEWDLQVNVVGDEYRVITVDDKVVQVNHRQGDNDNRSYTWVGVTNAPRPVKQIAKDAARLLTGRNIIGWDIILVPAMNKAYVLEGNSCPGMSEATAKRIIDYINGRSYEDA